MRALDQNQLSNKQLIAGCQDSFLIPDIAWFENIKSAGWRDDVHRSFEGFHPDPSRLHVAFSVAELLRRELRSRAPLSDPIDHENTGRLKVLLRQTDYVMAIEANVESLRQHGLEPMIHLAEKRLSLSDAMAALSNIAGSDLMSRLRRHNSVSQPRLIEFAPHIAVMTDRTIRNNLADLGVSGADQMALSTRRSAFYRMSFCFWAQVFQYALASPSLQTGDCKLLNDLVDSDYAVIASYCDTLETNDDRLRQRYDALVSIVR